MKLLSRRGCEDAAQPYFQFRPVVIRGTATGKCPFGPNSIFPTQQHYKSVKLLTEHLEQQAGSIMTLSIMIY